MSEAGPGGGAEWRVLSAALPRRLYGFVGRLSVWELLWPGYGALASTASFGLESLVRSAATHHSAPPPGPGAAEVKRPRWLWRVWRLSLCCVGSRERHILGAEGKGRGKRGFLLGRGAEAISLLDQRDCFARNDGLSLWLVCGVRRFRPWRWRRLWCGCRCWWRSCRVR